MSKTLTRRLAGKDNFVVDTVKFIKKEVGAIEDKVRTEARAIAIRNALFGGAIGIVVGIVGTSLWEKYMATPAPPAAQRSQPV
jgi:hypothetical protein